MIEVKNPPSLEFDLSDYIFSKTGAIPTDICNSLVEETKNNVSLGSAKNWDSLFHKCQLDIEHKIHQEIEPVIKEASRFYNTTIDFVEPYHIKKYTFGNFYGDHIDNFSTRLDRKLSIIVQLSNSKDYGAGDLEIVGCKMPREKGTVIVFPSHFMHKVNKIGFGERWVLISWAWGPAYTRG